MSFSRRHFFKILAAGGAGAAASGVQNALAAEDFHGYPDRYGMLTDVTKCIGCRSCEAGCNEQNKLPAPDRPFEDLSVLDTKRRTTAKAYTVVNRYQSKSSPDPVFRKIQCNHCNEPACVSACFVKALRKTKEGPVLWDETLCVGCRYCMISCPFYIPAYEYDSAFSPRVMKCTMCFDKFTAGKGAPACSLSCPNEAIVFGKRSDLLHLAHERIRRAPDKYLDHVYGEFEVGGTSWLYLSSVPFDDIELPTNLGTTPYPKYTKSALAAVPMIVVLWPMLLGGVYAYSRRRAAMDAKYRADAVADAIETTRSETQAAADKSKETALARAKTAAERELKTAVDKAVKETLEAASAEPEQPNKEDAPE